MRAYQAATEVLTCPSCCAELRIHAGQAVHARTGARQASRVRYNGVRLGPRPATGRSYGAS